MKTWKRALALVLALVMALSLVALPSFAAGEETGGGDTGMPYIKDQGGTVTKDGLVMSKTIKKGENGQFLLTLEAYATGSTTTTTSTKPVDIVLVLDVSGSMKENLTEAGYRYNEVYDLSTNGTYYYKNSSNGQYQRAYYCDGKNWSGNSNHDAGWYTRNHQSLGDCWGESGTRLIPKTSSADTTGTQFYVQEYVAAVTKMNALKSAVKGFVNSVSAKSPESNIAIVKFGAEINNEIGNDFNGSGWNYTQTVKGLTPASSSAELNAAVDALQYGGYTPAHLGLQLAKGIIEKDPNTDRQKVLVLFTDGEPNGVDSISGFETSAANKAIANSKSIKAVGATVYTIGCFGTTPSDTSDTGKYMNYVSSNYPNATSMTSGGDKADPANYYKTVSSAADLNNIFTDISQTIGGTTVTLGSTSVLRDVISDSFTLPEGYKDGDIKAYSVDCTAVSNDGSTYTWSANHDTTPYSVTVEGKTINVTGFDYAANWVGKDTTTGEMHTPAKKLVVEIPIVPEQDATGSVKTNGDASGIYADSTVKDPVEKFPSPVVYIPYFTVVHVASTVNDQGHNEGKRTGETHHPVWCNRPFNLTSVVTENYLYGGTFNEETCTTVHKDVQEQGNPMELNPTENATYYIWEVPNTYLRPFAFWVSRHLEGGNGTQNVTQMYLLSLLDRVNYLDAGLYVQFEGDDKGEYISSGCEQLTGKTGVNKATVYQMLEYALCTAPNDILETWYLVDGNVTTFKGKLNQNAGKYLDGTNSAARVIDDGCIIGHRLDNGENGEFAKFQDHSVTYRPYWITQDGVRVEGLRDRTYSFVKDSDRPTKSHVNSYETKDAYEFVGTGTQAVQTLSLRTNMLTAESEPAVENVTVTVVDAAKTYELTVSAGTGIRDQVAYQAPAGKVFAGWFTDQAYTTPADLDQVTEDTTIYAKYVSDSYLDLAYSRTGLFRLRGVTLISAVDNPANYQASGFIVGDQKVDVSYASRYLIFKTPANLFGAARDAKLMLADKSLSGTGDLEVTPYWVTLDGTEVHGVTHTLHYNTRTIWE
jgi:hypothetical protein